MGLRFIKIKRYNRGENIVECIDKINKEVGGIYAIIGDADLEIK